MADPGVAARDLRTLCSGCAFGPAIVYFVPGPARQRFRIGEQRVALAAQGIDIDQGSALEIQLQTAEFVSQDALTISNNAWREAWGFRAEANSLRFQGQFAQLAASSKARSTLITGGLKGLTSFLKAGSFIEGKGGSIARPILGAPTNIPGQRTPGFGIGRELA